MNIENQIIDAIKTFVEKYMPEYEFTDSTHNGIEFYATHRENNNDLIFIRIIIVDDQIQITNIFVPYEYRYNGYGKKTLSIIRSIAEKHGCQVILRDVVDSFKNRLLKRGARDIGYDNILLTKQTNLE